MSNVKTDKYLPIGTVVMLKNATKRLMITGFCVVANDQKGKLYDYCGCLFPEGVISSNQTALFDHEKIEKIYYVGYSDDEEKEFKKNLVKLIKSGGALVQNNDNNSSTVKPEL